MPRFAIGLLAAIASGCGAAPRPRDLLPNAGKGAPEDRLAAVAARYAPVIYHATDPDADGQDELSNIDFDGNLVGNDNWENFERFRLAPTVYYAALETETHWFIAYHLFHPRDWNHATVWMNDTHENDGENLQVVARKSDGAVVLLWTQAHYRGHVYARPGSGIAGGATEIAGEIQLVRGRPAVFVEAQGHGIYGTLDPCSEVAVEGDGRASFEGGSGVVYGLERPFVPYALESITTTLWPLLRDGALSGDGRLLDGAWPYRDELVSVEVPRYYDADRPSGPLGSDRGISPFALDLCWEEGSLGALFFNPAKRYPERLAIEGPWSRRYVAYPFGPR